MHHFNPENMEELSRLDVWRQPHWLTMIDQVILDRRFEVLVEQHYANDDRCITQWREDLTR